MQLAKAYLIIPEFLQQCLIKIGNNAFFPQNVPNPEPYLQAYFVLACISYEYFWLKHADIFRHYEKLLYYVELFFRHMGQNIRLLMEYLIYYINCFLVT